ncbi:hypothetical protein EON65_51885, partial [archaeon]
MLGNLKVIVKALAMKIMKRTEEIGEEENLMESGLDSLGITELTSKLGKEFSLSLLPTVLFDFPSVDLIANHLHFLLDEAGVLDNTIHNEDTEDGNLSVFDLRYSSLHLEPTSIGIFGISCLLPGDIDHVEDLWEVIASGKSMTCEVSLSRWNVDAILSSNNLLARHKENLDRIRYGGFLSTAMLDDFDGGLYGISSIEAEHMAIEQKLALKLAYMALENAGLNPKALPTKRVGVFVGASGSLRASGESMANMYVDHEAFSTFDGSGSSVSVIAGRISYLLGLRGPSLVIDTACSSSLCALQAANRSLEHDECDLAIVIGVSFLSIEASIAFAMSGMLSTSGHCHTFDEGADGYGRAEGGCAVVLAKIGNSLFNSSIDPYVKVRSVCVGSDGKSANLTAPNGLAQAELIARSLSDSSLSVNDINFIEAHGTGTKLGDPVEVAALAKVFKDRPVEFPLYISSAKAIFGHMEAAAGLLGLVCAIYSVMYGVAIPNPQLSVLNKHLENVVANTSLTFPLCITPLKTTSPVLRAGVSSFGFSGTIAHVIIESLSRRRVCPQRPSAEKSIKLSTFNNVGVPSLSHRNHFLLHKVFVGKSARKYAFETVLHSKLRFLTTSNNFWFGLIVAAAEASTIIEYTNATFIEVHSFSVSETVRHLNVGDKVCCEISISGCEATVRTINNDVLASAKFHCKEAQKSEMIATDCCMTIDLSEYFKGVKDENLYSLPSYAVSATLDAI